MKILKFDLRSGKIERRFTSEWATSGFINMDKIPEMVGVLVTQRKEMIEYIEALHDKLDRIIEENHICSNQNCHKAGCTSEHK